MEDPGVTIPLTWFLTTIAGLAGVIGVLGRTIFQLQNKRAEDAVSQTTQVLTALNDNTKAIEQLTDAVSAGGA